MPHKQLKKRKNNAPEVRVNQMQRCVFIEYDNIVFEWTI